MTLRFIFAALVLFVVNAEAANRYLRPGLGTGSNNGTSWADAYQTWAAAESGAARGDTVFFAGGSVTENVTFNTAASGSTYITFKKANAADNSGDAGWQASFATTVAELLGEISFGSDYWIIDGVTRTDFDSGHGMRIERTSVSSGTVADCSDYNFVQLKNIEIEGVFSTATAVIDGVKFNHTAGTRKGILLQGLWIHNVSRNGITTGGVAGTSFSDYGFLVQDTMISETGGVQDEAQHGQGAQLGFASETGYFIFNRCVFRNSIGSAFIAMLGGASDHHDGRIWNCLFYITDLVAYSVISPGAIWSHSTPLVENIDIANCTFYGIGSLSATGARGRVVLENATGCTLRNCLFENNYFPADHDGVTESYNGYYGNTGGSVPSGTPNQVNGGATTFVNAASEDFSLVEGGYAVGAGQNLSASFTDDILNATRTVPFDLGAYKFGDSPPATRTLTIGTFSTGTFIKQR